MNHFTIDRNENGFHVHGLTRHCREYSEPITPLYCTRKSYEECIQWLEENYKDDYVVDAVNDIRIKQ